MTPRRIFRWPTLLPIITFATLLCSGSLGSSVVWIQRGGSKGSPKKTCLHGPIFFWISCSFGIFFYKHPWKDSAPCREPWIQSCLLIAHPKIHSAKTSSLTNFSRKLHENEEILGRGSVSLAPPRSANGEGSARFLCSPLLHSGRSRISQRRARGGEGELSKWALTYYFG